MMKRNVSLASVVAATLVTVTTLLLVPYTLWRHRAETRDERRSLEGLARVHASALGAALALPVWNIDRPQIESILEAMARPKSVYGVSVTTAGAVHGRVRNGQWELVPWDGRGAAGSLIVEERPIVMSGRTIGTARLYITTKFMDSALRRSLLRAMVEIAAVDVLLIIGTYFILWRTVLRPLVGIERYAASVRDGEDVRPPAIREAGVAELRSLAASIESMVQLLEARHAELERLRHTEKLASMGSLLAGVAHEVRNPLFGISALLDAYELELSGASLGELRDSLDQQVVRLKRLMAELLEFGKPVHRTEPGALRELIDEIVASRTPQARRAGIVLESSGEATLPLVSMDRSRMQQVLDNLVENALQHSAEGGSVTIAAEAVRLGGRAWVECRVEDRGPGLSDDDLVHLWEPFYTRRENGIGLGLPIVQRIVDEHGGRVTADNRAEGGAVIRVLLPAVAG